MLPVQFFVPSLFPRFVFRRQSTFSGCLNTSRMRILKCMLIFDRARGCWVFVVCLLLTDICEGDGQCYSRICGPVLVHVISAECGRE